VTHGDRLVLAVLAVGVVGWAGLRYHTFVGEPVVWTDTRLYEQVAAASLWSGGFWAGPRTWGLPLLYKLVSGDSHRALAQFLIADFCWLALAVASARAVCARLLRVAVFGLVLAFSLLPVIIQWESDLMSDSLGLSLTALLLAAWLELLRRPNWWRMGAVTAVTLMWVGTRDDHAYVVLFTTPLIALSLFRREHRAIKAALLVGSLAVAGLGFASAEVGVRWSEGFRQTMYTRLVRDPAIDAYFKKHAGAGDWVSNKGRRVYVEFLVTHPWYTLSAPFSSRATDTYAPGRPSYKAVLAPDTRFDDATARWYRPVLPAFIVKVLYVPDAIVVAAIAVLVAIMAAAYAAIRGWRAIWAVPAAGLLVFYPHALMVWHAAAADLDRHSLVNAVTLRLSTLLLVVFIADAVWSSHRHTSGSSG